MNKNELLKLMEKVNDCHIANNPDVGDCAWERAAYFLGDMAAYEMTGKQEYLDYATEWANKNGWAFFDDEKRQVTNADSVLCGETYLDLIDKYGVPGTDKNMLDSLEWTINDPHNDYWWWVDTMYMALNMYSRIGVRQGDSRYFDKGYKLYYNSKVERRCYDADVHLWYRDERFLPENQRTASGGKIFWSRGNGWIFAGLSRTLGTIDETNPYYEEYKNTFCNMAEAIKKCQCGDGFWHTNLLEPEEFDMPETSGTVLFVLGYLQGIRLGILPKDEYLGCAMKGFEALTNIALDESGFLGWVQVVAWGPGPVKKECTNDYAVGAYLQVLRELIWMTE